MGMGMAEVRCLRLAARQHGVISRAQARELGLSQRQVSRHMESGRFEALLPSVYRVEGAPRSWRQRLNAASLWAGRGFAFSHGAAAALHGFARFREGPAELILNRKVASPPGLMVHFAALSPKDVTSLEGFRVTSATRTLLDLAGEADSQLLAATLDDALRRRVTTLEKLKGALAQSGHRRGVRTLRPLVVARLGGAAPVESELEARVVELLEVAGLPTPVRQHRLVAGGRARRLDFRIPGTPVVIEADGYAFHSSLQVFESDRTRANALTARGFKVLHWTWAGLRDRPEELLAELRRTLVS